MPTPPSNAIRAIVALGHTAPSADNSQPWHFTWDGEQLHTGYDTPRVGGKTFAPTSPATLLAIGATLENLSLLSGSYGADLTIDLFPSAAVVATCTFAGLGTAAPSDEFLSNNTISRRHTNRFAYQKNPIPEAVLGKIRGLAQGSARIMTFSSPGHIKAVAEMANKGSQVRFQSREVHEWLASSLRFDDKAVKMGDGMDVKTLDLPPGGVQFLKFTRDWRRMSLLNRLGAYRFMAAIDAGPLKVAPAVVAVHAPPTRLGAIEAGRLLTRAWTYLNNEGLAVHPYYVVSDQLTRLANGTIPAHLTSQIEELKYISDNFFELGTNETLHMLLRVGYPTREAHRSLRVPIDNVFTDLTATPSGK